MPAKTTKKRTGRPRSPLLPVGLLDAVAAAAAKKATDIVVLDLRKAGGFTDYFVICTGHNPRQIKAVADAVEQALASCHVRPSHVEGYQRAGWILIDCFDFVVHVFSPEMRTFYALDRLWGSATAVDLAALAETGQGADSGPHAS